MSPALARLCTRPCLDDDEEKGSQKADSVDETNVD